MKHIILSLLLLSTCYFSVAQNCYRQFFDEGLKAYNTLDFERAIHQFKAAKICEDCPVGGEVDEWISKTQSGYIDAIKKARDEAVQLKVEAVEAKKEAVALRFFVKGQEREFKGFYEEAMDNYGEAIHIQSREILFREQRAPLAMSESVAKYILAKEDLTFLIENGPKEKLSNYYNDLSYVEEKMGNFSQAIFTQSNAASTAIDIEQKSIYSSKSEALDELIKENPDTDGLKFNKALSQGELSDSWIKIKDGKDNIGCEMDLIVKIGSESFIPKNGKFSLSQLKAGTYPYEVIGSVTCPGKKTWPALGKGTITIRPGTIYYMYWEKNKYNQCEMWVSNY